MMKKIGEYITGAGNVGLDWAFAFGVLIVFDWVPTWRAVVYFAVAGLVLMFAGRVVSAIAVTPWRSPIREREER